MSKSSRLFTPQARQAAIEARRRMFEERGSKDPMEIFVVRLEGPRQPFGWEIRTFGSFVIDKGDETFTSQEEARAAGEKALSALAKP